MTENPSPEAIARSIAIETAEDADAVGDFVQRLEVGDNVYDYRFESRLPGYAQWQWAVSLYHDVELDSWSVNESSLVPIDEALMPPVWVPWKDRLLPSDLSVTDTLGTDADDERLEPGFRKTGEVASTRAESGGDSQTMVDASEKTEGSEGEGEAKSSEEDVASIVEEYRLSRKRVLSRLGREKVAQRWYDGPHGPKSLSTKTANGLTCETCAFFVPLKGELNMLFGVCANKWSPDDGRVVSLDHGCGEHSEIEPPEPETLWPDRKPAYDDLHIDVVKRAPREEAPGVETIENLEGETAADVDTEPTVVAEVADGAAADATASDQVTVSEAVAADTVTETGDDAANKAVLSEAAASESVTSEAAENTAGAVEGGTETAE